MAKGPGKQKETSEPLPPAEEMQAKPGHTWGDKKYRDSVGTEKSHLCRDEDVQSLSCPAPG